MDEAFEKILAELKAEYLMSKSLGFDEVHDLSHTQSEWIEHITHYLGKASFANVYEFKKRMTTISMLSAKAAASILL